MGKQQVSGYLINREDLARLFDQLKNKGYQNIGNIYRDGALMLEEVEKFDELATGFYEDLEP